MSNTGQLQSGGVQAFQKGAGSGGSTSGSVISIGFIALGIACAGVAVATSVTRSSDGGLGQVAEVIDRVGLDKGPLFLFGALFVAFGCAFSRVQRGAHGSTGNAVASAIGSFASDMEGQGAILASLQTELSSLRSSVTDARREAQEARDEEKSSNGEASDPMFRLAASLDQLGARIEKRMDGARQEMLGAVQAVAARIESVDSEIAAREDSTPERIDELLAELAELKDGIRALAAERRDDDEAPVSLPYELTGSVELSSAREESDKDDAAFEEPISEPTDPPVSMTLVEPDAEFPEPPAPMPKPSEGLELIDEMNDDKARAADMTPPLFPEIDPSDFGG